MGLDPCDRRGVDSSQAWHPVGLAPALELLQARELRGVRRQDELSASLVRDPSLGAVLEQLACALDAETGLQRARLVVDARVDHARAVGGLMRCWLGLTLEHADRRPRVAVAQLAGHREPHDPAPDDRKITPLGWDCARRLGGGHRRPAVYRETGPGPPGAVAAAASSSPAPYRRSSPPPPSLRAVARSRAVSCAGVGRRPSTRLAMISAAVAETWGTAIDVPS